MNNSYRKLWISITCCLLALGLIVWGINRYKREKEDTWYCYDTQGHPAEGVLIICRYGLANYPKTAVTHRFSDANGKIVLDFDWDTPQELIRGISSIYSSRLRTGCAGDGERWHEGQPVPETAVYFDEWNHKIFLKSGADDRLMWGGAINSLVTDYGWSIGARKIPGMARLEKTLEVLVARDRTSFLSQYGEDVVPLDEIHRRGLTAYFVGLHTWSADVIKYKNIILPLPKNENI